MYYVHHSTPDSIFLGYHNAASYHAHFQSGDESLRWAGGDVRALVSTFV